MTSWAKLVSTNNEISYLQKWPNQRDSLKPVDIKTRPKSYQTPKHGQFISE